MKKEDFIKVGLDEDAAKKCEVASTEELKGYIPKVRFDEVNNEKKKLELDVRDRDGQLETLKNSTGDVVAMKKQIEDLQTDNKKKDEDHAAEINQLKIDATLDSAITGAKGKNAKAIKALLDMSKIKVDKDGNVTGHAEQLEALVRTEDSKFLFNTETKKTKMKGAEPGDSGKADPDNEVDTSKMSYEELCTYMEENPDATLD